MRLPAYTILSVAALFVASGGNATVPVWTPTAQSVVWNNTAVTFDSFDCAASGNDGIVIKGKVTISVPLPAADHSQIIRILCPNLRFEPNSEIDTKEDLRIKISSVVSGPAVIINIRGNPGADASPTPELWAIRTAQDGGSGARGGDGGNAGIDWGGPHGADDGGAGGRGQNGGTGSAGMLGAPGFAGAPSSNLQLWAATFADGATVKMSAVGGPGGTGGKGGRGTNGGHAGNGGEGGNGGNGDFSHNGKTGGNGGNGGDGGDGGNGGQGGSGGPGGNGGGIIFYVKVGGQLPADVTFIPDGGGGGAGGQGGDFGIGGLHGNGAKAGCGGHGGEVIFYRTGGGGCGTNGIDGKDGRDGKQGPPGVYGPDGQPGNVGRLDMGFVKPADF